MIYHLPTLFKIRFIEANPDKGTETNMNLAQELQLSIKFIEANPDKGTETIDHLYPSFCNWFIEANPDKGTETMAILSPASLYFLVVYRS